MTGVHAVLGLLVVAIITGVLTIIIHITTGGKKRAAQTSRLFLCGGFVVFLLVYIWKMEAFQEWLEERKENIRTSQAPSVVIPPVVQASVGGGFYRLRTEVPPDGNGQVHPKLMDAIIHERVPVLIFEAKYLDLGRTYSTWFHLGEGQTTGTWSKVVPNKVTGHWKLDPPAFQNIKGGYCFKWWETNSPSLKYDAQLEPRQ